MTSSSPTSDPTRTPDRGPQTAALPRRRRVSIRALTQPEVYLPIVVLTVFLGVWEWLGTFVNPILFAPPSEIAQAAVVLIRDGVPAFGSTRIITLQGLTLTTLNGLLVGFGPVDHHGPAGRSSLRTPEHAGADCRALHRCRVRNAAGGAYPAHRALVRPWLQRPAIPRVDRGEHPRSSSTPPSEFAMPDLTSKRLDSLSE